MTVHKRLNLTRRQLAALGCYFTCASASMSEDEAWRKRRYQEDACKVWLLDMDEVARAAVIRLGLTPMLSSLGCIPEPIKPVDPRFA
jgi:hypothetical protein